MEYMIVYREIMRMKEPACRGGYDWKTKAKRLRLSIYGASFCSELEQWLTAHSNNKNDRMARARINDCGSEATKSVTEMSREEEAQLKRVLFETNLQIQFEVKLSFVYVNFAKFMACAACCLKFRIVK